MLSDSDSESSGSGQNDFTINEHYAKAFAYRKEREELAKLKEKYGSDAEEQDEDDEDDSEDETEDEDGEELTPAVDAAILRTLARIKKKDPAIYDSKTGIFEEEEERTKGSAPIIRKKAKESKPFTIQQQRIASALAGDASRSPSPAPNHPTHVEQQAALRSETISAFHGAAHSSSSDDEDGDLLVLREKSKEEAEREEEEYRAFLEREVAQDIGALVGAIEEDVIGIREKPEDEGNIFGSGTDMDGEEGKRKKKKSRRGKQKATKEETDQEFLMNYILNRGWIDRSKNRIPTYSEVTGLKKTDEKKKKKSEKDADEDQDADDADPSPSGSGLDDNAVGRGANDELEEDDEFDDVADHFESSYNFRFEEPDAANIARFPRAVTSAARRDDTKRKEARARRKERKEAEKEEKREEIRRLKALKMKDLRAKLERIGKEGGGALGEDAQGELDLEGEWDADAHDQQMRRMYGGEGGADEDPEDDAEVDAKKPTWDDDIDINDILPAATSSDNKKKKKKKKDDKAGGAPQDDGVDIDAMDADVERPYRGEDDEEEWDGTEEMRKRKLDEYMEELYAMEFNDIVGGQPTRFHYTPVAHQSYALSAAEILMADDADLNEYVGLKKIAPYQKERSAWDPNRGEKLHVFKEKMTAKGRAWAGPGAGAGMKAGGGAGGAAGEDGQPMKKRKGKKERERAKAAAAAVADTIAVEESGGEADLEEDTAVGRKKRSGHGGETAEGGEQTKKKRRRHKGSAATPIS